MLWEEFLGPLFELHREMLLSFAQHRLHRQRVLLQSVDERDGKLLHDDVALGHHDQTENTAYMYMYMICV